MSSDKRKKESDQPELPIEGAKPALAKKLADLGFNIMATSGTAEALKNNDIKVEVLPKLNEGRPNVIDLMKDGKISLIINTPSGKATKDDEIRIRSNAILHSVPLITTISGAQASVNGIENLVKRPKMGVKSIQEYHKGIK